MNTYRVIVERTRTANVIRQTGNRRSFTLQTPGDIEEARDFVQRTECDHNRPWRIVGIEAI